MESSKQVAERIYARLGERLPDGLSENHIGILIAEHKGMIESEISRHTEALRAEISRLKQESPDTSVFHDGCNYMSRLGSVCMKCGKLVQSEKVDASK